MQGMKSVFGMDLGGGGGGGMWIGTVAVCGKTKAATA